MKKTTILSIAFLLGSGALLAQSEMDAFRYSKLDITGSARYMGMAGAFCSLGADISTLSNNPAGLGMYRNSEVAATLNLSNIGTSTNNKDAGKMKDNRMKVSLNNIGYVAAFRINNSSLKFFNIGFSYNQMASFNRTYKAGFGSNESGMPSSLTNYIAAITNEDIAKNGVVEPGQLIDNKQNNPYFNDNRYPWLSVLGQNAGLIDGVYREDNGKDAFLGYYNGFSIPGDINKGSLYSHESGYIGEYAISLSGNANDRFYFGATLGLTSIRYELRSNYTENSNYLYEGERYNGDFTLSNYLSTRGTGINFKIGAIGRLTDNWRVGLSIHTPTYYSMTDRYDATAEYFDYGFKTGAGSHSTPRDEFDYNLRTPWQLQVGTSYMLGKKAILSFDYEFRDFSKMKYTNEGFEADNDYIKEDFRAAHTFKFGAEFRLTNQLSLRGGYALQSSGTESNLSSRDYSVVVLGTAPQYTIDFTTNYFTAGLGYRFGNVYADLAFVFKHQEEAVRPFSYMNDVANNYQVQTSQASLDTRTKTFLLTLGYKF